MSSRRFDPTIDYYAILQVEPSASRDEITRSYRQLMRRSHPDRFSDPVEQQQAGERAKDLNAAYAVLSRPETRADYDRAAGTARLDAQTMRSRYATPRSTVRHRQPTYSQRRSATRRRPVTTVTPPQRASLGKAIRQLIATFLGITVAIIVIVALVAIAFAGLQALL